MYGKILNTRNQKILLVPVVYYKAVVEGVEGGREGFSLDHCVWSFLSDILYNVHDKTPAKSHNECHQTTENCIRFLYLQFQLFDCFE